MRRCQRLLMGHLLCACSLLAVAERAGPRALLQVPQEVEQVMLSMGALQQGGEQQLQQQQQEVQQQQVGQPGTQEFTSSQHSALEQATARMASGWGPAGGSAQHVMRANTDENGAYMGMPRMAGPGTKLLTCTPEQAAEQAHQFKMRSLYESGCAPNIWMSRYQGMMPAGHKIIFDIGCNQGFSSVEFFDMFAPELGVNKRSLMQAHTPPGQPVDKSKCGACVHDCLDVHQTPELLHGHRTVDVHCIEPSNVHYATLVAAREMLFGNTRTPETEPFMDGSGALGKTVGSTTGIWHLHNMAVSNETGLAYFSADCNTTQCHLSGNAEATTYQVQVTTVDDLLKQLGDPPFVTMLKIDTEGFDMNVLAGASKALEKKVVQMLEFEYNHMNHWKEVQLKDVVDWLELMGYTCYFEGLKYIFKITGACWHPKYEFHNWSNVVCGPSGGQIELLLDSFSYVRYMKVKEATDLVPDDFGVGIPGPGTLL